MRKRKYGLSQSLTSGYNIFSPATFTNKTWTIRWNFSFLPKDYNGLILETVARENAQTAITYSNETVLQVVGKLKIFVIVVVKYSIATLLLGYYLIIPVHSCRYALF